MSRLVFDHLVDKVRGRSTPERLGMLMLMAFMRLGGTFVKIGQQLSTRFDLLPAGVCWQLSLLLDHSEPIPIEAAVEEIERVTGRPLSETFAAFDPEPLGCASVACVYHAVLKTGEHVAVKVRRPRIGEVFAADMAIFDGFMWLAEFLTIAPSSYARSVPHSLRTMLFDELDLRAEGRMQDIFRRQTKRDRINYLSAPKVYFDYSGTTVLVTEFVRGIWMHQLISAVDSQDAEVLERCKELRISPKKVARRLMRARNWAVQEGLFYHADPHPANILVLPKGRLCFIDFGACGSATYKGRHDEVEFFRRMVNMDAQGVVQVFQSMLSPLPLIDTDRFTQISEEVVTRWMYGFASRNTEWWERTSAELWIQLLGALREFHIPVNPETIRIMRSTLLYDTVAARLYKKLDFRREFKRYEREEERRALARVSRGAVGSITPGRVALGFERWMALGDRLTYRLQRFGDGSTRSFISGIDKASGVAKTLLSMTFQGGLLLLLEGSILAAMRRWNGQEWEMIEVIRQAAQSPVTWTLLSLLSLRAYRQIQFYLSDFNRRQE